jgi:pSer/pThr/pTyr-binding forkhead associated (FHA) protein
MQPAPDPVEAAPFAAAPSGLSQRPAAVASAPVAASSPSVAPMAPTPAPVAAPAAAPAAAPSRDMIPCPKCGKPVVATYAFCGACGQRIKPAAGAPAAAAPQKTMFMAPSMAPAAKTAPRGHLTLIRPDGTEGGVHPLHEGENLIGRGQGSLFDADPYLSPRHAEFVFGDEGLVVRDLRSLNGVFAKIVQEEHLESGDIFRIGQELLRFDVIGQPAPLEDGTEIVGTPNPGYWGRISVVVGRDVDGPAFPLFDESVVLGRERGDILFPEDGYVSGTHAQITLRDGQVYLSDLGSSNGTFVRIRSSRVIPSGSLLLLGQQLFRASYR